MDIKEIKRQLAFMESMEAQISDELKTLSTRQKVVKDTIKNLKALLPKEKADVVKDATQATDTDLPE